MVMHNTRKIVALATVNTTPNRATVVIITLMIICVNPHGSCCHHFKVLFHAWASYIYIYVTAFPKTCIVHTSNFSNLKMHKICYEYQTGMKLSGIVKLLSLYLSTKFRILICFLSHFVNL